MAESSEPSSSLLSTPVAEPTRPQTHAAGTAVTEQQGSAVGSAAAATAGEQLQQPEKRKRGRPRKPRPEQPEEPKEKRPRGRPKGSKNKYPSKASLLKNYSPQKTKRSRSRGADVEQPEEGREPTASGSAASQDRPTAGEGQMGDS